MNKHTIKELALAGPKDARKVFRKLGTCSRTFTYLLNREFGHPHEESERAADPLAGGILQKGHQCGMLWGSSLAIGAEAYRRCTHPGQAMIVAMNATRMVMASFEEREKTIQCREITHCDFNNRWSMAKYLFSGRFLHCFKLADQWAPEAVQVALKGLSHTEEWADHEVLNCASEVARKMGATDEQMVMVAGFAGGLGLSGSACGALSAAIWMRTMDWCRAHPGKSAFKTPEAEQVLNAFLEHTNSTLLCREITRKQFLTQDDHTTFIQQGGCSALIKTLAHS